MTDPHRPRYHFSPDKWMNDPVPFYAGGWYHVCFQHNPGKAAWGDMHWGRAESRDLCRWEQKPIALAPTKNGPDHDGVWTGCVTRDAQKRLTAIYTAIPHLNPFEQTQSVAWSDDNGATWRKHPGNPILTGKPEGFGPCWRDPQVFDPPFPDAAHRYMVIGGEQTKAKGGAIFLYRAPAADLTRWEYQGVLFAGGPETGHDFECPDLFPLGSAKGKVNTDRYLLITSRNKTWWHAGCLGTDLRFKREAWGVCDGSGLFYAAKSCVDGKGRRLLWGWLREARPEAEQLATGWSGVLSLPRVITAGPDGTPRFHPAPELEMLRRALIPKQTVAAIPGTDTVVPRATGAAIELLVRFRLTKATRYGVSVRRTPDGAEQTRIVYDAERQTLGDAPLALARGEILTLRVFVDHSVIEVFDGRGRACHTYRTYPTRPDALGVAVFTDNEPLKADVETWKIEDQI